MTTHCPSTYRRIPCNRPLGHTGLHLHADNTGHLTYWNNTTADKKATA